MAGKCKEMNKIKQVLRLHLDGESNRSIGRKLDLYKGTVNKYITLAESFGGNHTRTSGRGRKKVAEYRHQRPADN